MLGLYNAAKNSVKGLSNNELTVEQKKTETAVIDLRSSCFEIVLLEDVIHDSQAFFLHASPSNFRSRVHRASLMVCLVCSPLLLLD